MRPRSRTPVPLRTIPLRRPTRPGTPSFRRLEGVDDVKEEKGVGLKRRDLLARDPVDEADERRAVGLLSLFVFLNRCSANDFCSFLQMIFTSSDEF